MQRLQTAIEAAKIAGAVLLASHDRDLDIHEKNASRTSIVTSADLRSQEAIFQVLRNAFPHDTIIGEEGSVGDERAEARWYVDPLDGTTNYSHRFPFSCVSISYCDTGGTLLGVVHDPHRDDFFVATRGRGATCNGQPIRVSQDKDLRTCLLATQVQSDDKTVLDHYMERMRRFLDSVRGVRVVGAPALALAYVACGWLDAFCENNMSPWDTLAGSLLITEAGGTVTDFKNSRRPTDRSTDILASNGQIHDKLTHLLR